MGNIGNRMIAYMVARALVRHIGRPAVFNVDLPEWGLKFNLGLHRRLKAGAHCGIDDAGGTTLEEMAARVLAGNAPAVVFRGFFQRYQLLREVQFYRECFSLQPLDIEPFADDELVLNIRAGELLSGFWYWYPLVPPLFYKTLIERTGLRPVLLGQLDDSPYVQEIMRLLPNARLLPSAGAMVDFNRLRHARHLCVSVSTFSWLAAWLSEAVNIHYPILGFLHPFCITRGWEGGGGVDLTPEGDTRYRYHLFPILNAAPQQEYLQHVATLHPLSVPVEPDFAAGLSARAKHLPGSMGNIAGVAGGYLRRYPDAAWSVALGQYGTAREHYEQSGRRNGYEFDMMEKLAWRQARPNLALGKPASQSSVSQWSRQPTPEADAAGAVNGEVSADYGFHTALEDEPWWQVDLGANCRITDIWLFNRVEQEALAARANRLAVDIGSTEANYTEVFRYVAANAFGGADGRPLIIRFESEVQARFIRIRLLHREFLHLNQVEVYGEPV